MKQRFLLLFLSLVVFAHAGYSQMITLAEYRADNNPVSGQSGAAGTAHVTVTGISRSPGLSYAGGTDYAASGFTTSLSYNSNDYFQVTITPAAGYKVSLQYIALNFVRDNNGPRNIQVRTSQDGYASFIYADGSIGTTNNGAGLSLTSYSNLQNLTTSTTIRVYGFNASSTSGSLHASQYTGYSATLLPSGSQVGLYLKGTVATAP